MEGPARSKMNTQIYEEACAWFVESRAGDLDNAARCEFDRWLRKSPEHLSAYLEIAAIWNEGLLLDPQSKWTVDILIELARESTDDNVIAFSPSAILPAGSSVSAEDSTSVFEPVQDVAPIEPTGLRTSSTRSRQSFRRWRRVAIAASIVVIVGGALTMLELSAAVYTTALGEQRSIQFQDGSTVDLNSRTKIRVKYSKQERDIELIEGQALFHVAHDVNRPFIVAVGATRVRAVGTQFDVYKKSKATVVTVVEGRVAVYSTHQDSGWGSGPNTESERSHPKHSIETWSPPSRHTYSVSPAVEGTEADLPPRSSPPSGEDTVTTALIPAMGASFLLGAGEQLTVTPDATQKTTNPNVSAVTAWTQREIVFDAATLSEVVEEFNRYNSRKLVIVDPNLLKFHISGSFSSTDPDSLIRFLRQRAGVIVTETSSQIRIQKTMP